MQREMNFYRTTKSFQNNHKTTALNCQHCNHEFLANRKTAKFCSSSCRSQFWMAKNEKKVITLAVPANIDDAFLDKIKNMLINYRAESVTEKVIAKKSQQTESFTTEKELRAFMKEAGYSDYKIPKFDLGIYYDTDLSIKKQDDTWEVKITA